MRKLNKSKLRKAAISYDREKLKKDTIKKINVSMKNIKGLSKKGKRSYSSFISDNDYRGYENMIVCRWMRRYSGVDVDIKEHTSNDNKGRRYIDSMDVKFSW